MRKRKLIELGSAVSLALCIHAAMFLSLVAQAPKAPRREYDRVAGVSIELVEATTPASSAEQNLVRPEDIFFDELSRSHAKNAQVSMPAQSWAAPTTLSDLLDDRVGKESPQAPSPHSIQSVGGARTMFLGDPRAQASTPRLSAVGSDGKVAPCWRHADTLVPVKIIVVIDDEGGMIGAPRVVHPANSKLDGLQSTQIAIALRAMAGCSPYSLARTAGQYRQLELDFSKVRDWERPAGIVEIR